MAFRAAMNRSKIWSRAWSHHHHLAQGSYGIVGASSTTAYTAAHDFGLFNSQTTVHLNQACRHYHLPPPPRIRVVDGLAYFPGDVQALENLGRRLSLAQFAVMMHNQSEDRNIQLKRLVRAHWMIGSYQFQESYHYLTLEGVDEKDALNVYFAEVYKCRSKGIEQLKKWQLVDQSFSYPFVVTRLNKTVPEFMAPHSGLGALLPGMTLQYRDGNSDLLGKIMKSEENASKITDSCSPRANGDSDLLATVANACITPMYNEIDYKKVVYYALSAVDAHNKNKGKQVCLKQLLHASREQMNGKVYYIMILKAMDEKKGFIFFHTILEVSRSTEELIKCHVMKELISTASEKKQ